MTDGLEQRAGELFQLALEQEPVERETFVRRQSDGDEALCHEVLSLLRADRAAGDFLAPKALAQALPSFDEDATERLIGTQLERYRILRLIATGGELPQLPLRNKLFQTRTNPDRLSSGHLFTSFSVPTDYDIGTHEVALFNSFPHPRLAPPIRSPVDCGSNEPWFIWIVFL